MEEEEKMSTAVANWPTFLTKLRDREEVAERTMAFCFDKPASFKFTPGQFLDVTLLNPRDTDSEGNARGFSIASAPYEDFIMVGPIFFCSVDVLLDKSMGKRLS
jgi:NAD(P)H-flavin reductase